MFFRITSGMLKLTVSGFSSGTGSNQLCTSFLPLKWSDRIHPVPDMSPKSASDSSVNSIATFMLFFQLSNLHLCIHSAVMDGPAVLLLVRTSFIDRSVKEILPMEQCIEPFGLAKSKLFHNTSPCRICWLYYRAPPTVRPTPTTHETILQQQLCSELQRASRFDIIQKRPYHSLGAALVSSTLRHTRVRCLIECSNGPRASKLPYLAYGQKLKWQTFRRNQQLCRK